MELEDLTIEIGFIPSGVIKDGTGKSSIFSQL